MPSDDVILSLRQIAGFPQALGVAPSDMVVMQRGGLGGPYLSISPGSLVANALATGGDMAVGGQLSVQAIQGGALQFSNGAFGLLGAESACLTQLNAESATLQGVPIATQDCVDSAVAGAANLFQSLYDNATVWSFNNRIGQVILNLNDVMGAGGAPIWSPNFGGCPTATEPKPLDSSCRIPTTAWVWRANWVSIQNWLAANPFVTSFNGRTGAVTLEPQDIADAVAGLGDIYAPINSPAFTGTPTGPTANPGSSTGQLATTAFVMNAVAASTAGVSSFNTRTGTVTLLPADLTGAGGALLASPAFTGAPTAPTAPPGNTSTQLATTAFVMAAVAGATAGVSSFNTRTGAVTLNATDITAAGGAALASPAFTGTPTAPTPTPGTNNTQIATTAYVEAAIVNQGAVTTFNGRSGVVTLIGNDISAAGGALLNSPTFIGTPAGPTAALGTSSTQLATTAFVQAEIQNSTAGVSSFNTRTGAVTLTSTDVTSAGGALLASPTFTGVPAAPTAATGTNDTQIATTAFVQAAITASAAGVVSFNTRTGAVTLTSADVSAAGGALTNSPALTGTPTAPTAAGGTNNTQVATTAFVTAAIGGTVTSFNSRTGAVTLNAADLTTAGGALLASPVFTGTPSGPTATAGSSTTQLATTAFVSNAIGAYLPLTGGALTGALTVTNTNINLFPLTVSSTGTTAGGSTSLAINHPANSQGAAVVGQRAGVTRWGIWLGNASPESGGNSGSDFGVSSFTDAGNMLASGVFTIIRATGTAQFAGNVTAAGGLTAAALTSNGAIAANGTISTGGVIQSSTGFAGPNWYAATAGVQQWAWAFNSPSMVWYNPAGAQWVMRWTPDNMCFNQIAPVGGNGPYIDISDERAKDEIELETRGLSTVLKLIPKKFRRLRGDRREVGFVADDVLTVLPEAVSVMGAVLPDGSGGIDSDRPSLGMSETPIIALLVNAVKELTCRLENLEAR